MKELYVIFIVFAVSWNVIANGNFIQDESESILELDKIPTRCPSVDVNDTVIHLAHETDCTKAYKCAWGKRFLFECPWMDEEKTKRLHFNKYKQYCDWPDQAGCITCPAKKGNSYPPTKLSYDNNTCNSYYECSSGQKQLRTCYSGYCFSATCQDCVRDRVGGNCD